MYNKQQIMSRAWNLFKASKRWVAACQKTFAQCLRQAWAEAKAQVADNTELDRLCRTGAGRIINGCMVFIRKATIAMTGCAGYYLDGQTYYARKDIKAAGFRWDCEARQWFTDNKSTALNFLRA